MTMNRPPAIARAALAASMALAMAAVGPGSSTAAEASPKATLRWKFKQGEVLHYAMDQTTVTIGKDPEGREMKQTVGLIIDMTWTVKSVDASGAASIALSFDRVRTSAIAPFGKFSFDSKEAGDAAGAAGPLFKMLVGAEFASKMNPRGEVTDIKLSDKLLATLRGDNEPAGAQGQFSEVGLKNIVAQMFLPLPDGAVDPGETWKRSMAIPAGPDGETRQIEQTFTLKGPDPTSAGREVVEFATKLEPPKADPTMQVTFKKETQAGKFEFDNAAGRFAGSTVVESVELSNKFAGKELPLKVDTTRTLTLSKDKSP